MSAERPRVLRTLDAKSFDTWRPPALPAFPVSRECRMTVEGLVTWNNRLRAGYPTATVEGIGPSEDVYEAAAARYMRNYMRACATLYVEIPAIVARVAYQMIGPENEMWRAAGTLCGDLYKENERDVTDVVAEIIAPQDEGEALVRVVLRKEITKTEKMVKVGAGVITGLMGSAALDVLSRGRGNKIRMGLALLLSILSIYQPRDRATFLAGIATSPAIDEMDPDLGLIGKIYRFVANWGPQTGRPAAAPKAAGGAADRGGGPAGRGGEAAAGRGGGAAAPRGGGAAAATARGGGAAPAARGGGAAPADPAAAGGGEGTAGGVPIVETKAPTRRRAAAA
jgi:hypothetical protein